MAFKIHRGSSNFIVRSEVLIRWKFPNPGWVKLNSDGASHGNPGQATAGGVVRNEHGDWLTGFAANLGIATASVAELWRVIHGLDIASERGYRRIHVEVDSQIVIKLIEEGVGVVHPLFSLVLRC